MSEREHPARQRAQHAKFLGLTRPVIFALRAQADRMSALRSLPPRNAGAILAFVS